MRKLLLTIGFALMLIPAAAQQEHTGYRLPDEPKRAKYVDYPSLNTGFWFAVQATPAFATEEGFIFQADVVAGYRGGEFFRFGPGVSARFAPSGFALPVYLDLRGNIISQESRMVVPYWSLDAGYTFATDYKGIYASPTVGIRVGMPRNDFIAGFTYILQLGFEDPVHAVGLRLGFEF